MKDPNQDFGAFFYVARFFPLRLLRIPVRGFSAGFNGIRHRSHLLVSGRVVRFLGRLLLCEIEAEFQVEAAGLEKVRAAFLSDSTPLSTTTYDVLCVCLPCKGCHLTWRTSL